MEFIIGFLLFFFAIYASFYIPGKLFLSRVFSSLTPEDLTILSWPAGISIFLLSVYIFSWIRIPYGYLFVLGIIFIFAFRKDRSLFVIKFKKIDPWSLGLIFFGSCVFLSLSAFSYFYTHDVLQFIGSINVMDGLLHIGYTKILLTTFPPTHAGLALVPLRGYHYFYDLLMSRFVMYYHFSPEDLYYRYFPLFISLVYGGGFWLISLRCTSKKLVYSMVLCFAYFAQSFAFVLSYFVQSISPVAELGSIYPLELILNPAIILSIGMMLSALYILFQAKPKILEMVAVGFLFGIILELKVYTGIIGISVLSILIFLRVITKRQTMVPYAFGILTTAIIVLITYVPNNFGAGSLWYSPFFAYSVFMQEPPFTSWNWELKRIIFRDHHNIFHLIVLYAQAVGLFWLLSLGSRAVALLGISALVKKSFWKSEENIAITTAIIVPILIGSFFVQSISIFDTKQFFWIAGAIIALPAGIAIGNFLSGNKRIIQIIVIGVLVGLSTVGEFGPVCDFLCHPFVYTIPISDTILLQTVEKAIPKNGYIVYVKENNEKVSLTKYPFSNSPVIAALTGRATYYEPESAQFALDDLYKKRQTNLLALDTLLLGRCEMNLIKKLLNEMHAHYILITNPNMCLAKIATHSLQSNTGLSFYQVKL